ncbi:hypothetical protein FQN54_005367 [Arachnomyces sp. PD_36]|nr:hypothetical protein FQN54_005367 [Arachnomyces sp. PD_36]
MQFPQTFLSVFLLGLAVVNAAPAADSPASIEKREYGCNPISGDDPSQCHFHCVNEVWTECRGADPIRPYTGVCGGPGTA